MNSQRIKETLITRTETKKDLIRSEPATSLTKQDGGKGIAQREGETYLIKIITETAVEGKVDLDLAEAGTT